jgi:hypothetical protein
MADSPEPYSVTGRVAVEQWVFDKTRQEFIESVGPDCAHIGKEIYLALIAEYDRRTTERLDNEVSQTSSGN